MDLNPGSLPADRCVEGEHVEAEEPDHRQGETGCCPAVLHRHFAAGLAGKDRGATRNVKGNLRPGVPKPHNQDRSFPQLPRVLVVL